MPTYSCDLCKKEFPQKGDLTKHQKKKTPCITMEQIKSLEKANKIGVDNKSKLTDVFKSCLNMLRDNEGLTGEKALRNMSYFIILKLIEPHFSIGIDIDTYLYDFSHIDDENVEQHKNKLLEIVRFSNLAKEKEDNIPVNLKFLWDDILSVHPSTKNIFLKGKNFDIRHQSTYKKIIDKIDSLEFSLYDILGEAYEEVIQDIMTGKVFGQFFTQPLVKNMMVKLINPQLLPDGKIESCCDPTMGTAGFLTSYINYIQKQASSKSIALDWEFIKREGIYGKEIEPDTYQLAVSNMLISTGHMFDQLDRGDSIREPITRQFDNILANPPFGIKGLNYDDFQTPLKNEYVPIKSDNAVSLFIQAIIHMLKINGKCAVVLPDGKDLFSKTNNTLIAIREYLMKTCDLKEIIYLPSGIFTYTSIKTCVFYFVKKKQGKMVLDVNINISKSQKETRNYKFLTETHQTTNVHFFDYNPYEDVKNLLVEVPIEKIAGNYYSLNYTEYIKDETEEHYHEGITVQTLGEVCSIIKGEKKRSKDGKEEGLYPLYYCSILGNLYLDTFDYTDEGVIVNKTNGSGKAMVYYGKDKYNVGETTIHFKSKDKELLTKYIYYYLFHSIELIQYHFKGANQKSIIEEDLFKIKIPIPSLERQKEIVKYLDFIYEKCIKTSNVKIEELNQLNAYCLSNQKMVGDNEIKELGKLCEFIKTGKNKPTDNKTGTLYPYYGTGSVTGYTDEYLFDGSYILTARNGTIGNCFLTEGKFFPSDHIFVIDIKDKCLMKYVYYILSNNEKLDKLKTGVGIPNITKGTLENLKIPVPSLERLKEIVEYCEYNDSLILQLEKEIEQNKKESKKFITSIMQILTE
jgi:type I restriction-modification system DNA methylase subunit